MPLVLECDTESAPGMSWSWWLAAFASSTIGCYSLVGVSVHEFGVLSTCLGVTLAALLTLALATIVVGVLPCVNLGSLFAYAQTRLGYTVTFLVGWSVVGECVLGGVILAKTLTQYVDFVTNGALMTYLNSCCTIGSPSEGTLFDPIAFVLIAIAGSFCCFAGTRFVRMVQCLAVVNMMLFVVAMIFAGADLQWNNWNSVNDTAPFTGIDVENLLQSAAMYSLVFFFLLASVLFSSSSDAGTSATKLKKITACIAACCVTSVVILTSLFHHSHSLNIYTPLASYLLEQKQIRWLALAIAAGIMFACLLGLVGMLVVSDNVLCHLTSSDLVWPCLGRKSISPVAVTLITLLMSVFHNFISLTGIITPGIFFVSQSLIIMSINERYSGTLTSGDTRREILFRVIKFIWLLFFITSPLFTILSSYFTHIRLVEALIQSIVLVSIMIFLQVWLQEKENNTNSLMLPIYTSLVMGVSALMMNHLSYKSWLSYFVWLASGLSLHFTHKHHKSQSLKHFNTQQQINAELGEENLAYQSDNYSRNALSRNSFFSERSHSVASFLSLDLTKSWSFRSAKEFADTRSACLSFRSARENFDCRSDCISTQSALDHYQAREKNLIGSHRQPVASVKYESVSKEDICQSAEIYHSIDDVSSVHSVKSCVSDPSGKINGLRPNHRNSEQQLSNSSHNMLSKSDFGVLYSTDSVSYKQLEVERVQRSDTDGCVYYANGAADHQVQGRPNRHHLVSDNTPSSSCFASAYTTNQCLAAPDANKKASADHTTNKVDIPDCNVCKDDEDNQTMSIENSSECGSNGSRDCYKHAEYDGCQGSPVEVLPSLLPLDNSRLSGQPKLRLATTLPYNLPTPKTPPSTPAALAADCSAGTCSDVTSTGATICQRLLSCQPSGDTRSTQHLARANNYTPPPVFHNASGVLSKSSELFTTRLEDFERSSSQTSEKISDHDSGCSVEISRF